MTTVRWVLHEEQLDRVPTAPLLGDLADDVADKMREFVPKDTRALHDGIRVDEVGDERATIESTRPPSGEWAEEVPKFVEEGTSDTPKRPYMRPATYIYRTP